MNVTMFDSNKTKFKSFHGNNLQQLPTNRYFTKYCKFDKIIKSHLDLCLCCGI